jgi:hypothetical protein
MYLKWLSSEFLFSGELSPKFPIVQGLATSINEKKLEKNGLFAIKLTLHYQRCQIVALTLAAAFVQTSIPCSLKMPKGPHYITCYNYYICKA